MLVGTRPGTYTDIEMKGAHLTPAVNQELSVLTSLWDIGEGMKASDVG